MSYNLDSYQEPFWAKSSKFVRGRDPLGVQNSSISVYANLLPGLTNLTQRLRYYGMYLFLLDEYKKLSDLHEFKKSPKGQFKFIRRAELTLAFVMRNEFPEELAVIGSSFASDNINKAKEKGYYDISLGADQLKDTVKGSVYWDYSSGALGQYYAGSLFALDLMETRGGYFERTEVYGLELANAYRSSMTTETTTLFLKVILEGKLNFEDIVNLNDIVLNKDYKNTSEGEFYRQMLLSNDGIKSKTTSSAITSKRKESLQLFLNIIADSNEDIKWNNMPIYCYKECLLKTKEEVTGANFGWYYYYLNELVHYSIETVFWGLLMEIDGHSYSLHQFLTVITDKVFIESEAIIGNKQNLSLENLIKSVKKEDFDTDNLIFEIGKSIKDNNTYEGILGGILSLICLYRDNKHKLHEAQEYANEHYLNTKHGNALAIFKDYIETSKSLSFKDFIRKVIHTLLNEHIAIAYAKMGNGEKNLLKFVIEDNYLIHIETMEPNFTNPRLKTLYNFTRDLGLVNENDQITTEGKVLLNKLNNGL